MECIVIADDHTMVRKGIKLLLSSRLECRNIIETDSCSSLLAELKNRRCTHLILDVVLSDGISLEIVPTIRKLYPDIKIMIFSMQPFDIYAEAFRAYNIYFYLSKSSSEEATINYLKRFLSPEIYPANYTESPMVSSPFSNLTQRELEILHYLINGYKTKEIAQTLNINDNTVSTFKHRIFEKTGTDNLAHLLELWSVNKVQMESAVKK